MEELAGRVLVASCEKGDVAAVREALQQGVPVNSLGRDDSTGLMRAVAMRHQEVVEELLRHPDIDINQPGLGREAVTPLHVACISDNCQAVTRLTSLPKLASLNTKSREGWTPIMAAVANGNEGAVRAMLQVAPSALAPLTSPSSPAVPGVDLCTVEGRGLGLLEMAREGGHSQIERLIQDRK